MAASAPDATVAVTVPQDPVARAGAGAAVGMANVPDMPLALGLTTLELFCLGAATGGEFFNPATTGGGLLNTGATTGEHPNSGATAAVLILGGPGDGLILGASAGELPIPSVTTGMPYPAATAADTPSTFAVFIPQDPMAPAAHGAAAGMASVFDMAPAETFSPRANAPFIPSATTGERINSGATAAVLILGGPGDGLILSAPADGPFVPDATAGMPQAPATAAGTPSTFVVFIHQGPMAPAPPGAAVSVAPSPGMAAPAPGAMTDEPVNPSATTAELFRSGATAAVLLIPGLTPDGLFNPGAATDMAPAPAVTPGTALAPGAVNGINGHTGAAIDGASQATAPSAAVPEGQAGGDRLPATPSPASVPGPHEDTGTREGRAPFPVLPLGPIHASQQVYDALPDDFPFFPVPVPNPSGRAPFPALHLAPVRESLPPLRLRPTDLPRLRLRRRDAPYGANAGLSPCGDKPTAPVTVAGQSRQKKRLRFHAVTRTLIDDTPGFTWTKVHSGHTLATPVRPEEHCKEPATYSMADLHGDDSWYDEPAANGTTEAATGAGSDAYAIEPKDVCPGATAAGAVANGAKDATEGQGAAHGANTGSDAYAVEPKAAAATPGMNDPEGATENNATAVAPANTIVTEDLGSLYQNSGDSGDDGEADIAEGVWDGETLIGSVSEHLIHDQTDDWTHTCPCVPRVFLCAIHAVVDGADGGAEVSETEGAEGSSADGGDSRQTDEDEEEDEDEASAGALLAPAAGQFSPFVRTFLGLRRP